MAASGIGMKKVPYSTKTHYLGHHHPKCFVTQNKRFGKAVDKYNFFFVSKTTSFQKRYASLVSLTVPF